MTRPRDELWDALTEALGADTGEVTESERARLNKCLRELRAVGATPEQVRERCAAWQRLYNVPANPQSLAGNWAALGGHAKNGAGRPRPQPHEARDLLAEPPLTPERRREVAERMAELVSRIGRDAPSDDNGTLPP